MRDKSAIGKIFACPKCGSMVMVVAPESLEPAAEADDAGTELAAESPSLQPSDWNVASSATRTSWLAYGTASVASVLLLASVAAFTWLHRAPNHSSVSTDSETVAQTDNAVDRRSDDPPEPDDAPEPDGLDIASTRADVVEVPQESVTEQQPADDLLLVPVEDTEDIFAQADEADDANGLTSAPIGGPIQPADLTRRLPGQENAQPSSRQLFSNLANLLSSESSPPPLETDTASAETSDQPAVETRVTTLANQSVDAGLAAGTSDLPARMDTRVRAVRFDKVPLIDFARSMMQLSGVAIQIDPRALEQTANSATVPISVAAIDQPIVEILRQALLPLKLVPVVRDNTIHISSPRLEDSSILQTSFYVGDLRSGRGRELDLATLVSTLIEPASWTAGGGLGEIELKGERLHVSNTRLATVRTLLLIEKLRVARRIPPRRRIPTHLTSLDTRWARIDRFLQRRINLHVWHAVPLPELVHELEQASKLRVLVDWHALARSGISPETTADLHARDRTAAEVFEEILSRHDLVLFPVDGETVQVTSAESSSQRRYLEFYKLSQLDSSGMKQIEQLMLRGSAALDPASEVAMVVCESETHRALTQ